MPLLFVTALVLLHVTSGLEVPPPRARFGELAKRFPQLREAALLTARTEAQTFKAPLDHFNASDTRTLDVRFWLDASCASKGALQAAPTFVHMGGEAAAGPVACGARETAHGALALGVEHRFYGLSSPASGLEDLEFLTVQQNLADTKAILEHVQVKYGNANAGVVAFGGSYSGATCAWFRMTYPNDVDGCVSESGVVHAVLNFTAFDSHVSAAVSTPDADCAERLQAVMSTLDARFDAGKGDETKNLFHAPNLVGTKMGDVGFMYAVADGAAMLDQYGNKAALCAGLAPADADPDAQVEALAKLLDEQYSTNFVAGCFYDAECVRAAKKEPTGVGNRSWRYQKCSQVAFLQAAPATGLRARSSRLTLPALLAECEYMFPALAGQAPRADEINARWGGALPKGSNILFINYSDDPWWEASIVDQGAAGANSVCKVVCAGCGHCGAGTTEAEAAECEDRADASVAKWLLVRSMLPQQFNVAAV